MIALPDPPAFRELDPARMKLRKEALMNEIKDDVGPPNRKRRAAAILLPAALLGVAATGYTMLKADEVVSAGIGCYDAPTEEANVTVVSATGESPLVACGELWEQGVVNGTTGSTPTLVACINSGGAVSVFPSDDSEICEGLGLQDLPDGYEREARRFVAMRDELVKEIYEAGTAGSTSARDACLSEEESLNIARRVLAEHRFDDWTAEVATGDYEGRECANFIGFEDREKKVLIIPSFKGDGVDPNPDGPH